MDINFVLNENYVRDLVLRVCGAKTELVTRPASYLIRSISEEDRDIQRIIVLPPRGYTADRIEQMNSHDEAEFATIEIKGAVRKDKNSFSVLRNCLLVASIPQNGKTSELNKPYMTFDIGSDSNPDLTLEKKSAGMAPFTVVKPDGYGFYHNLVNLSDEWLVLQLYKRLRPQRPVSLAPHLEGLLTGQAESLSALYDAVVQYGDGIYKKTPALIENIVRMPIQKTLPALAEMLYVHDSGRHEACSVFSIILKIGKMHPDLVKGFLRASVERHSVPSYYAEQLISKIDKYLQEFPSVDGTVSTKNAS